MITILNGRILDGDNYLKCNAFYVKDTVETPIYLLGEDKSINISKLTNKPAINHKSFSDGGAWTYFLLTPPAEQFMIKYFIQFSFKNKNITTEIYFKYCKDKINNFSIKTIDQKNKNMLSDKILINGLITYDEKFNKPEQLQINKQLISSKNIFSVNIIK